MSYFNMQYLKRKHFYHRIQFHTEKVWFIWKKIEKNQIFPIFLSRPILTTCLRLHFSQICAKKFQNWVYLCFRGVLKLKVTKGELIISNGLEMADAYLLGGVAAIPPPALVRVKSIAILLTSKLHSKVNQNFTNKFYT